MQPTKKSQSGREIISEPLSIKEITKILIKHYGVHDGIFDLAIEFTVGFGPIGPNEEELYPGVALGIRKLGLAKADGTNNPNAVNAAEVNPAKKSKIKE